MSALRATTRRGALQAVPDPTPRAARGRSHPTHGERLLAAIEAVDAFPKVADAGERIQLAARHSITPRPALVHAAESDVAIAAAVLRAANEGRRARDAIRGIRDAVDTLGPGAVADIVNRLPTADFFETAPHFGVAPDSFRLHAVAVQQMTLRLSGELERGDYEELLAVALLHDIGKLVMHHAFYDYPDAVLRGAGTPEEWLKSEQLAFGVDHAVLGGIVARRWGLPACLATTIENHHRDGHSEAAAVVRLADMLVHHGHGDAISPAAMVAAVKELGLQRRTLRRLMYELPAAARVPPRTEPPPLTRSELAVLRKLAEGKVYKQIALELGRSTSTVRTHLNNVYRKLEVADRAQAVLLAVDRGWIPPGLATA